MTPERWREVSRIYGAVLAKPDAERKAAAAALCRDDVELRQEVESLLASGLDLAAIDSAAYLGPSTLGPLHGSVIGSQIGVFRIDALLGVGGMGEVYRARDTKLNRDVAIKILPPAFANDPKRLARFKREAQLLAALNHPNIAAIYGLESLEHRGLHGRVRQVGRVGDDGEDLVATDGAAPVSGPFLVLELVEGPTLADRIADARGRGARAKGLPLDEVLSIARQIADALEAAHEQGIIHRDLKPANIKVRDDGTVKVLDFGLAKALEKPGEPGMPGGPGIVGPDRPDHPGAPGLPGLTQSLTLTSPVDMTGVGVILGTAAYMSPEQAKGTLADKRADIWAFGCVLYEMLSGEPPFKGDNFADTLAAILKLEPDWASLPHETPRALRRVIQTALRKRRSERLGDFSTVRFALDDLQPTASEGSTATAADAQWRRAQLAMTLGIVLSLGAATFGWWRSGNPSPVPSPQVLRYTLPLQPGEQFTSASRQVLAISPDGTQVAFTANQRLYRRRLDEPSAQMLVDGLITGGVSNPVFSPDGKWIAFYSGPDRAIKRISSNGGEISTICVAEQVFDFSWSESDLFVSQGESGVLRAPVNGEAVKRVVALAAGESAYNAQGLPGAQDVLFTLIKTDRRLSGEVVVQSLVTGKRTTLLTGSGGARYVRPDRLVFVKSGVLMAAPFDIQQLQLTGPAIPVVEGVQNTLVGVGGQFAAADNGTLVYVAGGTSTTAAKRVFVATRPSGNSEALAVPAGPFEGPRVSPDRQTLLYGTEDGQTAEIYRWNFATDSSPQRLTFGGHNRYPVWTRDSRRFVFQSDRSGDSGLYWQSAEFGGEPERLTQAESGSVHIPESMSPAGDLLYDVISKTGDVTLWSINVKSRERVQIPDVASAFPTSAEFSPDGRWIAFGQRSNLPLPSEMFLIPFPPNGARQQVLRDDPHHPLWSRDGRQLFYVPGPGRFAVVEVGITPSGPVIGAPRYLSRGPISEKLSPVERRNFDLSPSESGWIGMAPEGVGVLGRIASGQVQVVVNWLYELQQRQGATR